MLSAPAGDFTPDVCLLKFKGIAIATRTYYVICTEHPHSLFQLMQYVENPNSSSLISRCFQPKTSLIWFNTKPKFILTISDAYCAE